MRTTKTILIGLLLLTGCTSDNRSIKTLNKAGYTNIKTTGYKIFACGKGDYFHTGFRAKNAGGQVVTGTVCCGVIKGCTIRF